MRIRQFIAAIMILLSLSAQARSALACEMMPGAALAACCCPGEGPDHCPPAASHGYPCCDQLASADAPLGYAAATAYDDHHAGIYPIDLPPVTAVESHLLPASFDAGGKRFLSPHLGASRHRVRPLYLQTARLRL